MKKNLVVLSGAGISEESGIKTFRDSDGLWEGHDVMSVASIGGWYQNPSLVLDFYNQRRKHLLSVKPNQAHLLLVELEVFFEVIIITQNVDDLHERAGSQQIIHLHGELRRSRSTGFSNLIYPCDHDILLGDLCERGYQIRPHIVWFGEDVPAMENAIQLTKQADLFLIVGSSLQVYPAAGLMYYLKADTPIYYIDPKPALNFELREFNNLKIIAKKAILGMREFMQEIKRTE